MPCARVQIADGHRHRRVDIFTDRCRDQREQQNLHSRGLCTLAGIILVERRQRHSQASAGPTTNAFFRLNVSFCIFSSDRGSPRHKCAFASRLAVFYIYLPSTACKHDYFSLCTPLWTRAKPRRTQEWTDSSCIPFSPPGGGGGVRQTMFIVKVTMNHLLGEANLSARRTARAFRNRPLFI